MKEYIKKFETALAADNYAIIDIPFTTSIATNPVQNLVCNKTGKHLGNDNGTVIICPPDVDFEMVDLRLPSGRLWAKTNLGAQTETDYGDYYQWAATTPLHVEGTTVNPAADWSLCPYTTDGNTFTKYTGSDYSTLQTSDDAVASQFAGYRMPTKEDFDELLAGTNKEWVSINGINGYKFTNKSDSTKYIFLPAAGYCYDSNLGYISEGGYYWSSNLDVDYHDDAYHLYFDNGEAAIDSSDRCYGFRIRPVC
jgi:uncharacterized protein (TIGR02145 family)